MHCHDHCNEDVVTLLVFGLWRDFIPNIITLVIFGGNCWKLNTAWPHLLNSETKTFNSLLYTTGKLLEFPLKIGNIGRGIEEIINFNYNF